MRKSLLITTLLALVLLSTSVVSAQSISVFGGLGFGTLKLNSEGAENGGLAIQAGASYSVTNELGIGFMFDRLNSSDKGYILVETIYGPELLSAKVLATLTGYDGIVHYNLVDSDIKLGVFGGVGLYDLQFELTAKDGSESISVKMNTESTFGFVAGGQAKLPLTADLNLTGNASYRSASFSKMTTLGITESLAEELEVSGWSFGGGIAYAF